MNKNKVHEIFAYLVYRNSLEEGFLENYLGYFDKMMIVIKLLRIVSAPLKYFGVRKSDYLFYSARFADILTGLGHEAVIFGRPQDFWFAVRHGIPFFPGYDLIPDLLELFRQDPQLESRQAAKLIAKTVKIFDQLGTKYLILWNDALFLERFLIYCARQTGVVSICVQHGIFQSTTDLNFLDGHYADFMLVWGESQRQLFLQPGFDSAKVKVLGYPYKLPNASAKRPTCISICILGQPWENCSRYQGEKKKKIFAQITEQFKSAGIPVFYKPHPYEDRKFFPKNARIVKNNLPDTLSKFDVFISLTSTALIEASLSGKIAVQFFDEEFEADDFMDKGYCYSHRDIETFVDFVQSLREPYQIPEAVISKPADPTARFLEIIDGLYS